MTKESSVSYINEDKRKQMEAEQEQIRQRVKRIKHQILVLSGKGGVSITGTAGCCRRIGQHIIDDIDARITCYTVLDDVEFCPVNIGSDSSVNLHLVNNNAGCILFAGGGRNGLVPVGIGVSIPAVDHGGGQEAGQA